MLEIYSSKLAESFQVGIFSELADYKQQKISEGKSIIDLSIGSPDLPPPSFVVNSLVENVQDLSQYGYTLKGLNEFHRAVQTYYKQSYGVDLKKDEEILLLMGSQDGLVHLPMTMLDPGDVVLVPDPGYPAYDAGVKLAQAKMYSMPLKKTNGFLPNLNDIPSEVVEKAKLMFLNFPGNPVPALANRKFFEDVVRFAKKNNIFVVHDFAYSELVFDSQKAISFMEVDGAKEAGVEFHSLSKSFNMAGCRIGYIVGHKGIIQNLSRFKSNLDYGVFSPIQKAATSALKNGRDFLNENKKIYEKRRNLLVKGLRGIGWDVDIPKGSMFIWTSVPKGYTSKDFVYELIDRAGVVVTPGHAFGDYGEGYVRIALIQPENRLQLAIEQIKRSGIF